jgi:hypothetical protein
MRPALPCSSNVWAKPDTRLVRGDCYAAMMSKEAYGEWAKERNLDD